MRAILFVTACASLATCTPEPAMLERIQDQGELRVITRNLPTTYFLGPDRARGLELELAQGFARFLGVRLNLSVVDTAHEAMARIDAGAADIAAAGLFRPVDEPAAAGYGPAYGQAAVQVIHRRGARPPQDTFELLGSRIETTGDPAYIRALEVAQRDHPGLKWQVRSADSVEQLVQRVARGEADYTVIDSRLFDVMRQYHPEVLAAFDLTGSQSLAWALPAAAPDLREAVAAYFAQIRATGELRQTASRYEHTFHSYDYVGARAFRRHADDRLPGYIPAFRQAAAETGFDWRLLAAIAYQESHWDSAAVSPTGVRGLMMLTEQTARIVRIEDREDPTESILGGARYLARVLEKIPARIAAQDRLWMALAAYNIGFGHLEDARILTEIRGGNPDAWSEVREHLPLLTDEAWHSRVRRGYARGDVTVEYVANVRRYYQLLQWFPQDTAPPDDTPAPDRPDRDELIAGIVSTGTATDADTSSY